MTDFEPTPPPIQFPRRTTVPRYVRRKASILPLVTCLWILGMILLAGGYLAFFVSDHNYWTVAQKIPGGDSSMIYDTSHFFAPGMTREAWISKGLAQAAAFGGCLASLPYAIFLAVWAGTRGK